MSDKFASTEQELDTVIPKLVSVLMNIFSDLEFVQTLLVFNSKNAGCKVQLQIDDLFTQIAAWSDRFVKNGSNGYNGYSFEVE